MPSPNYYYYLVVPSITVHIEINQVGGLVYTVDVFAARINNAQGKISKQLTMCVSMISSLLLKKKYKATKGSSGFSWRQWSGQPRSEAWWPEHTLQAWMWCRCHCPRKQYQPRSKLQISGTPGGHQSHPEARTIENTWINISSGYLYVISTHLYPKT